MALGEFRTPFPIGAQRSVNRKVQSSNLCPGAKFSSALRTYGVLAQILTDNGKVFTGRFAQPPVEVLFDRICRENGVDHILTQPRSPTTTGKIERFHCSLRVEFNTRQAFRNLKTAQEALDEWVSYYNTRRPHQALGDATPASRFLSGQDNPRDILIANGCYLSAMRLEPLYTLRFRYPEEGLAATIGGDEQEIFLLAEGRAEGGITGRFRGANHPRRRADRTFRMNLQGAIETDDGAHVVLDYQGYGRSYPAGRRQVVGAAWHFSDHERYRRLNDSICVITGEVRRPAPEAAQVEVELVFEVAELVWEPLPS